MFLIIMPKLGVGLKTYTTLLIAHDELYNFTSMHFCHGVAGNVFYEPCIPKLQL